MKAVILAVFVIFSVLRGVRAECDDEIIGWTVNNQFGTPPPDFSAASIYGYGDGFVAAGGASFNFTEPMPDNLVYWSFEDIYYFDVVNEEWLTIPTTGTPPPPRGFFDGGITQDALVIYGGSTPEINNTLCLLNPALHNASYVFPITINNDSYILDFFTLQWEKIPPMFGDPGPRTAHAMTVDENGILWVFGGFNNTFANPVSDLWNFEGGSWNLIVADRKAGSPPPRYSHFLVSTHDGYLWMFHGRHGHTLYTDMWRFNIGAGTWSEISQTNPPDQSFSEGRAVFVNGLITFNGGQKGGGGEMRLCSPEPQTPSNETWVFDPISKGWTLVIFEIGSTPEPSVRGMAAVIGNCHYRWGGIRFRDDNGKVIFNSDINVRYVQSLDKRAAPVNETLVAEQRRKSADLVRRIKAK